MPTRARSKMMLTPLCSSIAAAPESIVACVSTTDTPSTLEVDSHTQAGVELQLPVDSTMRGQRPACVEIQPILLEKEECHPAAVVVEVLVVVAAAVVCVEKRDLVVVVVMTTMMTLQHARLSLACNFFALADMSLDRKFLVVVEVVRVTVVGVVGKEKRIVARFYLHLLVTGMNLACCY